MKRNYCLNKTATCSAKFLRIESMTWHRPPLVMTKCHHCDGKALLMGVITVFPIHHCGFEIWSRLKIMVVLPSQKIAVHMILDRISPSVYDQRPLCTGTAPFHGFRKDAEFEGDFGDRRLSTFPSTKKKKTVLQLFSANNGYLT